MKKTLALVSMCCVSLSAACGGPEDFNDPSQPTPPSETTPLVPVVPAEPAHTAPSPSATTPTEAPSTITVTGQVLRSPGVPETAALVYIPGKNRKPQVVDLQGGFTIPDVTPPYDLIVRMKSGGTYARVYLGLTLTNPTVFAITSSSFNRYQSSFSGKVTGQQSTSSTSKVSVAYAQPMPGERWNNTLPGSGGSLADAAGAYSFSAYWPFGYGEGSLFAYQYTTETGRPRNYVAFGRRDNVPFTSTSGADIALSPVTSSQLSLDLSSAPGNANSSVNLRMSFSPTFTVGLESVDLAPTVTAFGVPEVSQATFQLRGTTSTVNSDASTVWFRSGLKPGDSVKAAVPVGVKIIAPVTNEKDIPLTASLSWSQVPNAVYSHRFTCGTTVLYIDQTTPQLVLPDLSAVGLPVKPGDACNWLLEVFSPVKSADEMMGNDYARQRERSLTETVYSTYDTSTFTLAK